MRAWSLMIATALLAGCGGGRDAEEHPGEKVYNRYCFSCHAAGVAGSPRVGDVEAWQPLVAKGREALLQATIAGVPPGMPPRGLCSDCSDAELGAAVDYMIDTTMVESE